METPFLPDNVSFSKHKIVPFDPLDSRSGTKKKKFLLHGTLKIVYQVYHSKEERKKENQCFFPTKKIKSVQAKRV